VTERPYVLLSVAASVDGYIDDATSERMLLSNEADFDRVDEVRASADAILVGASTIRRDNPRLLVRSASRRDGRTARGLPESPVKVTLTSSGNLDPAASFFTTGQADKIVYAASAVAGKARERLADEIHLVIAPFFVGDPAAPQFPGDGTFPHHPGNRMELAEARQIGDVVLLRYLLH
jgi:5-amino-6-(5-phosphoribosylamino)uracil reductase